MWPYLFHDSVYPHSHYLLRSLIHKPYSRLSCLSEVWITVYIFVVCVLPGILVGWTSGGWVKTWVNSSVIFKKLSRYIVFVFGQLNVFVVLAFSLTDHDIYKWNSSKITISIVALLYFHFPEWVASIDFQRLRGQIEPIGRVLYYRLLNEGEVDYNLHQSVLLDGNRYFKIFHFKSQSGLYINLKLCSRCCKTLGKGKTW